MGRIDLLVLGRSPCVIDYKSGVASVDGHAVRPYERQLQIYAWLVSAALNVDIQSGALFSLRQGIIEVELSASDQTAATAEALEAKAAFNARVPGAQPATPSVESCGWCPFVGRCGAAWEALGSGAMERIGWGDAIRGTVAGPVMSSASGHAAIPVDAQSGTICGPITIIDVPASAVVGLTVGARVSAWSLARRATEPVILAWREDASHLTSFD
jgi:hypothetical protein